MRPDRFTWPHRCPYCEGTFRLADRAGGLTYDRLAPPDPERVSWWHDHYQRHTRASRRYGWRLRLLARLRRALRPDPGPDPVTGRERR